MRTLKSRVAKVSTVRVENTFALVAQHSERKCESHLSSSPNWLVVIEQAQFVYFSYIPVNFVLLKASAI